MKKIIICLLMSFLVLSVSCSKDKEIECNVEAYIGTWEVTDYICLDTRETIEITQGSVASSIKLEVLSNTFEFAVTGCRASFKEKYPLLDKEGSLELEGDELKLDIQTWLLILPTSCKMTLKKIE